MDYKLCQYLNLWSISALLYGQNMGGTSPTGLMGSRDNVKTSRDFLNKHFNLELKAKPGGNPGTGYDSGQCTEIMKWNKKPKYGTDVRKDIYDTFKNDSDQLNKMISRNKELLHEVQCNSAKFRVCILSFLSETLDSTAYISSDGKNGPRLNETDKFAGNEYTRLIKRLKQRCRESWGGNETKEQDDDKNKELKQLRREQDDAETLTWLLLLALLGEQVSDIYGFEDFLDGLQAIYLNKTATTYRSRFFDQCLFLNKAPGKQLTLQDIYQRPVFTCGDDERENHNNIDGFLRDKLNNHSHNTYSGDRVLTVLGKPGTGKTSLAQYIISDPEMNRTLLDNGFNYIHVRKFADMDLSKINWNDKGWMLVQPLMKACGFAALSKKDLILELTGTFLVLDGFDEIEMKSDGIRETILEEIYQFFNVSWKGKNKSFFLMIACRVEYVPNIGRLQGGSYITIQSMERKQIVSFCRDYNQAMRRKSQKEYNIDLLDKDSLYEKTEDGEHKIGEVLGIPMILYMVIGLNLVIDERDTSVAEIYDRIFKAEGGIFDPSEYEYDESVKKDRKRLITTNKTLLLISKQIALQMFQYSPDKTHCSDKALDAIIRKSATKRLSQDGITYEELSRRVKGDNYLEHHENDDQAPAEDREEILGDAVESYESGLQYKEGNLTYIHRSIYEYFMAVYIFDQMKKAAGYADDEGHFIKLVEPEVEKAEKILRVILQTRQPSLYIWKFLSQKMYAYEHPVRQSEEKEEDYNRRKKNQLILMKRMEKKLKDAFLACLQDGSKFLFLDRAETDSKLEVISDAIVIDPVNDSPVICMRHELICFLNYLQIIKELDAIIKQKSDQNNDSKDIYYAADSSSNFYSYVRQAIMEYDKKEEQEDENPKAARIREVDFGHISMPKINLHRMDFAGVKFEFSNLQGAKLEYSSFRGASIVGTDFSECAMEHSVLRGAQTVLDGKNDATRRIDFHGADIRNSDFQSCNFSYADFTGCHLEDTNMYRIKAQNAEFTGAWLNGTDLCYSDLTGAKFQNAHMIHVKLESAELLDAEFCDEQGKNAADLMDSNFSGAKHLDRKWMEIS